MMEPGNPIKDTIVPIPFFKSMEHLVANISCGNTNAGRDATDWILGVGFRHVRNELNAKTLVWLYKNQADLLIGFGSLGKASWLVERVAQTVQFIPMLGLFAEFQGLPKPDSGSDKYSSQLLDHLLDEAQARLAISKWVGLSVRTDNYKAIRLYEKAGFEWLKNEKGLCRMLLRLD